MREERGTGGRGERSPEEERGTGGRGERGPEEERGTGGRGVGGPEEERGTGGGGREVEKRSKGRGEGGRKEEQGTGGGRSRTTCLCTFTCIYMHDIVYTHCRRYKVIHCLHVHVLYIYRVCYVLLSQYIHKRRCVWCVSPAY